jgi:hypothetical protein
MHPETTTLIAFSDSETGSLRGGLIARHIHNCEKCRLELEHIRREKEDLAALGSQPAADVKRGLAEVLSAAAGWREVQAKAAPPELKRRARSKLDAFFGSGTAALVARPDLRTNELLESVLNMVSVFLGQDAAEAVMDDLVGELKCAALTAEAHR